MKQIFSVAKSGSPQSNQRGIETPNPRLARLVRVAPQSNQRGIETFRNFFALLNRKNASIEPAWD